MEGERGEGNGRAPSPYLSHPIAFPPSLNQSFYRQAGCHGLSALMSNLFICGPQKRVAFFPPGQTYFAAWGERRGALKQSEEGKRGRRKVQRITSQVVRRSTWELWVHPCSLKTSLFLECLPNMAGW